jgi:hypothetical protein
MPQLMIFDTEVFSDKKADNKAYLPPDETVPFPEQFAEIESVRQYTK